MGRCKAACNRAGSILLASAVSALLLSGCTSLAPPGAESARNTAPAPATGRAYHDAIELGGRLSLRYEQNGREQALDGKFTWIQESALTRITLQTPFGQTLATIDVTPQASTLLQSGQPPRSEANVDALTATALGWPLPIAGLRNWLQGFALDEQGARFVATSSATGSTEYVKTADGWLIQYPAWEAASGTEGIARPKRIDLQRSTTQAGNVTLRIVLDQWQPL